MKLNSKLKTKETKKELAEVLVAEKEKHQVEVSKVKNHEAGVAIKSFEGGQMPLYRRLPKRGFNSLQKKNRYQVINISKIVSLIDKNIISADNKIDLKLLKEKKLSKKVLKNLKY